MAGAAWQAVKQLGDEGCEVPGTARHTFSGVKCPTAQNVQPLVTGVTRTCATDQSAVRAQGSGGTGEVG